MNEERDYWLLVAITLSLLFALALGIGGCARKPICDALTTQIEKADTHDRLEQSERLYRRHCV